MAASDPYNDLYDNYRLASWCKLVSSFYLLLFLLSISKP